MIIDKKKVGEKIHQIRKLNGYSMEQFGKLIDNAPKGSVNSWEKGVNLPNKERLELISIMGNMSTDELLYGSLNEYVSNLIETNLGVWISSHFIDPFVATLKEEGFSYGDDVHILRFAKGFFNSHKVATTRPSVYYSPVAEEKNLFIAYQIKNKISTPYYWAFADLEKDILHITPYTFNKAVPNSFECPSSITEPAGHDYFTSGLLSVKMQLRNFKMIYYTIDSKSYLPTITKFIFDIDSDSLIKDDKKIPQPELHLPFCNIIDKESIYLKQMD